MKLSSVSERLVELLVDGNWHDLEQVLAEVGKLVPPGQAMREMERSRRNNARTPTRAVSGRMYDIDEQRHSKALFLARTRRA